MSVRSLQLDGGVVVPGLFDCPTGVVHLRSPSRIGTLRSENLRIVPPLFPPARRLLLVVDRIEAKDVEIAGVDCEYLRADRVRLGPHAHVTRLDGEVIRRHPTAVVGPWAREPIPPGLSR